jgi:hypothetical protein
MMNYGGQFNSREEGGSGVKFLRLKSDSRLDIRKLLVLKLKYDYNNLQNVEFHSSK